MISVVVNPSFQHLQEFARQIPERFDSDGTLLYRKRNVVKLYEIDGMRVVVKRYKVPMFHQRVDYTFIRPSKAKRAYLFALRLQEMGIETPTPIAYIEVKQLGLFRQGYFLSTYTTRHSLKESIGQLHPGSPLFEAYVRFLVEMHDKGFLHGDQNLSNILWYEAADGIHFEVIDVNRSHFKISPTKQECLDNLMRVTHDRRLSADVVSRYAELRGWQKDECVAYIHAAIEKYEKRHEFHKHFKRRKTK
jgi:tRNA A-37 threonylcarbamoyl transferase component Bud32